jgi:hypothetical protein
MVEEMAIAMPEVGVSRKLAAMQSTCGNSRNPNVPFTVPLRR